MGGNVSYAVKCNVSENCALDGDIVEEEEAEIGGQNITSVGGNDIITVDGHKTYLQLESPRIQIAEDASQVRSEREKDPSKNDAIIETESDEGVSSGECPAVTFEISVPVSPAPTQTPMPKQGCYLVNIRAARLIGSLTRTLHLLTSSDVIMGSCS